MDQVRELIRDIKEGKSQTSVNVKDELNVMKAMLNTRDYEVDVYNNKGVVGTFNPSNAARNTLAIGISAAAKVPMSEAEALSEQHEFGKKEAQNYIDISKQFVLGYGETGRKMKLGTRIDSDVSVSMKDIPSGVTKVPNRVDGTIQGTKEVELPAYQKMKVSSPCPKHLKG
jgi:hypothetical protein